MQLQVFASSGPFGTALSGHFSAQQLHLLPLAGVGLGQGVSERSHSQTTEKRGNTMNTETTANNVATLPAAAAPKTSREVIQANVDLLIQQLEAGH